MQNIQNQAGIALNYIPVACTVHVSGPTKSKTPQREHFCTVSSRHNCAYKLLAADLAPPPSLAPPKFIMPMAMLSKANSCKAAAPREVPTRQPSAINWLRRFNGDSTPSSPRAASRLCGDLREAGGVAVHVLLEPLDLTLGAVADLGALVAVGDGDVQGRLALAVTGGGTTGVLNQQGQGSNLEQQAQLGLGGGRGHVGEHTLLLDQDLEHIRHHTTGVAQSVLLTQVEVDQALVVGVVEGGAQVAGGEQLALTDVGGLLDVQPLAVVHQQELVGAGVALDGHNEHGAGTVHTHDGGGLYKWSRKQRQLAL